MPSCPRPPSHLAREDMRPALDHSNPHGLGPHTIRIGLTPLSPGHDQDESILSAHGMTAITVSTTGHMPPNEESTPDALDAGTDRPTPTAVGMEMTDLVWYNYSGL
jgi:hypothetical protein